MKKYRVTLVMEKTYEVEVSAKDEKEARALANYSYYEGGYYNADTRWCEIKELYDEDEDEEDDEPWDEVTLPVPKTRES